MAHQGTDTTDDLFLELAQDQQRESEYTDEPRPTSRDTLSSSRLVHARQRRISATDSLLASALERRDSITGQTAGRTPSRLETSPNALRQYADELRRPGSRRSANMDDSMSPGQTHHTYRQGVTQDWSMRPMSRLTEIRSPEPPSYGRRRPSFASSPPQHLPSLSKPQESPDESPAEKSNADSTSVDSQTADTVWDELDDLKSRIKKLELTGKLPLTSNGIGSGDSSERPRTATTAPTTIDSSPKHERKPETEVATSPPSTANPNSRPATANVHPLLHEALAKAKLLLNPSLYRMLETTATEALQIAALTGSAGPQGTTYSAASVINGATVSDRHVRRKADNMCRNLTDLCLALCEGKHELVSHTASPVTLATPIMIRSSPTVRYARSSIGLDDSLNRSQGRPMSRLEARRSSMLGTYPASSYGGGTNENTEDPSGSDRETTPQRPRLRSQVLRRVSRASDRLRSSRGQRYEESVGDDDALSVRPPSRAMTDFGAFRSSTTSNSGGTRGFATPSLNNNRTSNLRESLISRRAVNAGAQNTNRELSRFASFSSDVARSPADQQHSTPPVMEEEGSESGEYRQYLRPKRRMASLSTSLSARRPQDTLPSRAASLSSRRPVLAE